MTNLILILAQIAAFQNKDHGINRIPSRLMDRLGSIACTIQTDPFADALTKFEKDHHIVLDDEVWEVQDANGCFEH